MRSADVELLQNFLNEVAPGKCLVQKGIDESILISSKGKSIAIRAEDDSQVPGDPDPKLYVSKVG